MVRLLLLQLCLIIGTAPIVASAGEVKLGDDITAGIQTRAEHDIRPFGYRVTWINWDSYFRDSDLRLGDRILGVNGERYRPETHNLGYAIGNHAENRYWVAKGAKDADPVTLIVERDGEEIREFGEYRTQRLVLDAYDRFARDGTFDPTRLVDEEYFPIVIDPLRGCPGST